MAWIDLAERNYRGRAAVDFTSMRMAQAADGKAVQDYMQELTGETD